jgi:hypothetical protein
MIITLLGLRIDAPFPRKKSIPIICISLPRILLVQHICIWLEVDWLGSAHRCTAVLLSREKPVQLAGPSAHPQGGGSD